MMNVLPLVERPTWIGETALEVRRFDPLYYDPSLTIAESLFQSNIRLKWKRLHEVTTNIYSFGAYELTNRIKFVDPGPNTVPFVNVTEIGNLYVDMRQARHIDTASHRLLHKSVCYPGTILLSMSGSIGRVAVVPGNVKECNSNQHLAKIVVDAEKSDPYFVAAYFATSVGQGSCHREAAGAVQKELYLYNISTLPILDPLRPVRLAIGNRLRAAESLRQIAALSQQQAAKIVAEDLKWNTQWAQSNALATWILPTEIENRLDGQYNSTKRIATLRHLRVHYLENKSLVELSEISGMIGWKGLTTEYYTDHGPLLIRGIDFEDGIIHIGQLVHVDEQKYEEQPQIHLLPGDIVLTKDGTIGKACVIPPINERLCAGSTVARIRGFGEVSPYYLEAILNHEIVQVQIQSMATGLAQPHITQEWLAQLRVPLIPRNEEVAESVRKHHECLIRANALTNQAVTDVESLIEGTLDEAACLEEGRKLADEFGLERP